jgi:hypothetical protein
VVKGWAVSEATTDGYLGYTIPFLKAVKAEIPVLDNAEGERVG